MADAALELPSNSIDAINTIVERPAPSSDEGSEEQHDLEFALRCIEEGKKYLDEVGDKFKKADDYYKAKQWPDSRPKWRNSPVANVCRPTVETILPIMTDTSPRYAFNGRNPDDYEFSKSMSMVNEAWWGQENMDFLIPSWVKDALMYPVGVAKVLWDEEKKMGLGDVDVTVIDPRHVRVKKGTVDFDKNCPWVVHLMSKSVGELKRAFPEMADQIKADGSARELEAQNTGNQNKAYSGDIVPVALTTRKSNLAEMTDVMKGSRAGDEKDVMIAEIWAKDETLVDYEDEKRPGEQLKIKKYPAGKVITLIPSQKLMLQSKPSPRDDGKFPFVRLVDNVVVREFYGEPELNESLYKVQDAINKVLAVIMDHATLTNNTPWIVDSTTGIDPDLLTNGVGQIIVKTGPGEVRRDPPPSMNPQLFQLYETLIQLADYETGVHDVTQGRKPTGVTAAEAIYSLQEAAQTRIRLKERNLTSSLTQLGYLVVATMLQNYHLPRIVKITGEGGNPEYYEIFIDKTAEGYVYHQRKYMESEGEDGTKTFATNEDAWKISKPSRGLFDISVVSGTSLPFAKEKRASQSLQLFDREIIDQEEVLTAVEWPNKEAVTQRMAVAAKAAAKQPPPQPLAPVPVQVVQ